MRRSEQGFSYVVVMFMVAFLALASVRALEHAKTLEKRDKEAQLLWAGMAYRNAIASYYYHSSGSNRQYPQNIAALLHHTQGLSNPTRPLRKPYRDPITGAKEWGEVRDADGMLVGVYSLSQQAPMKRDGFPPQLASFKDAKKYSDWKFVFKPN